MTMSRCGVLVVAFSGFSLAVAQTRPIPDVITLFKDVQTHQRDLDGIRENYTFRRLRRTEVVDKNGVAKSTVTVEREVFFVNGHQIGRLVKRDGVALDPSEEKKEQARVKQLIDRFLKSPLKPGQGPGRFSMISQILAVATVSNPRRLVVNGRDTLAFDFTGDRAAHASSMEQNAVKKTAGTIWFDEADRQVARLEVVFDENFRVGGGLLASIQKGTNLTLVQSPVGEGLWMQTLQEQFLSARVIAKSLREKIHIEDSDFKRFNVETMQHVSPPDKRP